MLVGVREGGADCEEVRGGYGDGGGLEFGQV